LRLHRLASRTGLTTALWLAAGALLATPVPALAGFERDETKLPASVRGAGDGADTAAGSGGSAGSAASGSGTVVRLVVGLAIVLAVIYGVYWLLRAYSRSRAGGSDERVEVIATTALGPNRALHLVRSGDEVILVGAAEHSVTPIRVYSAAEAQRLGIVPAEPAPYELSTQLARQGQTTGSSGQSGGRAGGPFLQRFVESLKQATVRS
jgi:flagellar protein FliO/FliZ